MVAIAASAVPHHAWRGLSFPRVDFQGCECVRDEAGLGFRTEEKGWDLFGPQPLVFTTADARLLLVRGTPDVGFGTLESGGRPAHSFNAQAGKFEPESGTRRMVM
jgi:hypothetical protein